MAAISTLCLVTLTLHHVSKGGYDGRPGSAAAPSLSAAVSGSGRAHNDGSSVGGRRRQAGAAGAVSKQPQAKHVQQHPFHKHGSGGGICGTLGMGAKPRPSIDVELMQSVLGFSVPQPWDDKDMSRIIQ
jgi:hypothetical protein